MAKSSITPPAYFKLDEEQPSGYRPEILQGILDFIRPYKRPLYLSLVLMTIGSVTAVVGPYYVKVALDAGIGNGDAVALKTAVLSYLFAALLQWGVTYWRVNIMAGAGQSVIYDMRARLFSHIQALSLGFFSRYSVGRLISRIINDVSTLRQFVTWAIVATARNLLTLVGIVIAMVSMDLRLSLYSFIVIPLIGVITFVFRKHIRDVYRRVRAGISWVNSVLAENINGVRVVQAFSRQAHNYDHFRNTVNQYHLENGLEAARLVSFFFPSIDFISTMATALVIWLGGAAVLGEQVTAGVLVAFVLYIERFFRPIQDLSRRYDQFQSSMIGGERILELLSTQIDIEDAPDAIDLPRIKGRVTFENVDFAYSDDPETPILEDINLEVKPGQTIALVGETGAGKTTIIKLLGRFYDTVNGQVLVDGHDVKSITQPSLRGQMGIVLQEPFLFDGSVYDNIYFGRLDATQEEVYAAAKAVGAHEFIMKLRHGYETSVEEGGTMLSVGQRQLISFARALLADPHILILDEATSSVDTQTELVIQKALATLLENRTSFVIAHRLSTIVNADQIVVVHQGKIIERGTHAELLAHGGTYYKLYSMGFQDQVEE
jgi:ATP-binding cassette subfamily B protein/subfamily B ATP-binding cassette protein MsbA